MQKFKSEYHIINGIYRIKIDVPFEVGFVCTYIFQIDDSTILIDSGLRSENWKNKFFSILKKINIPISSIDYCIVSHNHMDHIGLVSYLKQKNPEIQILMHDITSKELKWETNPENYHNIEKQAIELAKQLMSFGMTEKQSKTLIEYFTKWSKMKNYVKPDRILYDNDEIKFGNNSLKIIWTPGHTLGHICIFDTNRKFLFSGDHILSRITPHIGNYIINPVVKREYASYNFKNVLKLYLNSLDRIEKLNPKKIFPAHQEIIEDPIERIQEIREHHKNRINEITNLISKDPRTPFEIAQKHFGPLDDVNTFLAVSEVLGHLIYLEEKDLVERIERDGKIFFQLKENNKGVTQFKDPNNENH